MDVTDAVAPQVPVVTDEVPVALAPTSAALAMAGNAPMLSSTTATTATIRLARVRLQSMRQRDGSDKSVTRKPTANLIALFRWWTSCLWQRKRRRCQSSSAAKRHWGHWSWCGHP